MQNINKALENLKQGRPVIIVDDSNRENEGDLVASAQTMTLGTMNFMIKHGTGIICMPTTQEQLEKLQVPMMISQKHSRDNFSTAFTYSIEASSNISTGVSAYDRLHTIKTASNPNAIPQSIVSPGHIFPLKALPNGLQERQGHTEASVALCKMANLLPSAAIVEIPTENGSMMRLKELEIFAQTYNLTLISIKDIIDYQNYTSTIIEDASCTLPTKFGEFTLKAYKAGHKVHILLSMGDLKNKENVPFRAHSKCITGETFSSLKCDCQEQLNEAMKYISNKGIGAILYLDEEGRDIGIINKIKAYNLQNQGFNTIEANKKLNLPVDNRNYLDANHILKSLQIKSIELITNNPKKSEALKDIIKISKIINLPISINQYNKNYIDTKIKDMKHSIKTNK